VPPLQHEFAHPGDLVYCSEPQALSSAELLSTIPVDIPGRHKDGGGISEPSGQRPRTP
jgi:hypothetical protein